MTRRWGTFPEGRPVYKSLGKFSRQFLCEKTSSLAVEVSWFENRSKCTRLRTLLLSEVTPALFEPSKVFISSIALP